MIGMRVSPGCMFPHTHNNYIAIPRDACFVTGIFVLLKKCPRIKFFRKFLSHGIKIFVLGQNISEKFCPRTKYFKNFLSHPNKICPTPKFSEKDKIRAKAIVSLARPLFLLQVRLSGKEEKVAKRRKGGLQLVII